MVRDDGKKSVLIAPLGLSIAIVGNRNGNGGNAASLAALAVLYKSWYALEGHPAAMAQDTFALKWMRL